MSRGIPTFTDSSRAMSSSALVGNGSPPISNFLLAAGTCCEPAAGRSLRVICMGKRFGDGETAIGAVRNHGLTGLKTELDAIELYRDHVRLERHQIGDAADLGIGLTIRPDVRHRCPGQLFGNEEPTDCSW